MKILEELEQARKDVAALEGQELVNDLDTDNVIVEEEAKEEQVEEVVEEVKEEAQPEPVKEEPKEEKKEEPKVEEVDDRGYARMRRELAALKKKLEEKEAKKEDPTPERAQELMTSALTEVIQTVQEQKAEKEFAVLESNFAQEKPDFHDVSQQYKAALYQSLRLQNPRESHINLLEMTKKSLLMKASTYMNQGLDPIEEMYEEAKSLGFKAIPKEQPKEEAKEEKKEIKPNLDKVAANRARNAGLAAAKGAGGTALLTKAVAAEMSVEEWSKLPASEKKRLLGG